MAPPLPSSNPSTSPIRFRPLLRLKPQKYLSGAEPVPLALLRSSFSRRHMLKSRLFAPPRTLTMLGVWELVMLSITEMGMWLSKRRVMLAWILWVKGGKVANVQFLEALRRLNIDLVHTNVVDILGELDAEFLSSLIGVWTSEALSEGTLKGVQFTKYSGGLSAIDRATQDHRDGKIAGKGVVSGI
ncbi:hypothetical protein BDV36DRAFT_301678 [Aspergillus pseudocaelatus]|uniref:Uncharacterized protein n=1 Tax=Aspergillus pseudocaelatus TaxID=1825620 RepID=A0ABQ6W364_9EURO|nr:hypothetical protein BDV36DRAFT_301678 [Aspergillus pseudocaelatus]